MAPSADTSRAGIRKLSTGESVIPSSTRPDGSVRREIRVKPGYKPPEDVELYKNRTADTFRNRGKGGVVGAEAVEEKAPLSAAAGKNAKRREARKKAAAAGEDKGDGGENGTAVEAANGKPEAEAAPTAEEPPIVVDPEAEKAKEARKLAKKLRQARELKDKLASVIKIQELMRQLDNLGFDNEGQKKDTLEQDAHSKKMEEKDAKKVAG